MSKVLPKPTRPQLNEFAKTLRERCLNIAGSEGRVADIPVRAVLIPITTERTGHAEFHDHCFHRSDTKQINEDRPGEILQNQINDLQQAPAKIRQWIERVSKQIKAAESLIPQINKLRRMAEAFTGLKAEKAKP